MTRRVRAGVLRQASAQIPLLKPEVAGRLRKPCADPAGHDLVVEVEPGRQRDAGG